MKRRKFIQISSLFPVFYLPKFTNQQKPLVISTWDTGIRANVEAWKILKTNGSALDAVEAGAKLIEDENNCCVGLMANPDREGKVTLDASIMDHNFNCGAVAFLERIKHPICLARCVMEKTPHVMLVGDGALSFAKQEGFNIEPEQLSPDAEKNYKEWLKKSQYKPIPNIENQPSSLPKVDKNNHDTISLIALDSFQHLAAACTTSGMAFKMRGRLGDSPIIGAGIYVENEIGAAAGTGQGEDCIRLVGSHTVVQFMARGYSPQKACQKAIQKILEIKKDKARDIQLAFIAVNKQGEFGGFSLQKGFSFAVQYNHSSNQLIKADYLI